MAATDFITEAQLDALTTTIATALKTHITAYNGHTHAADTIGITDSGDLFSAADVESALAEVMGIAQAAAGGGVSINDAATNTTQTWSSSKIATEIVAKIAETVDMAPAALDTLNELAAALGDDPNFAATINAALAQRVTYDDASEVDFAAAFTTALA